MDSEATAQATCVWENLGESSESGIFLPLRSFRCMDVSGRMIAGGFGLCVLGILVVL